MNYDDYVLQNLSDSKKNIAKPITKIKLKK